MRKTFIAVLFASTLPTLAMAMPDEGQRHHGDQHSPFEQLDLTKEQRTEMRQLMREQMKNHREISQRYLSKLPEAQRKAMQEELKANQEKTQQQVRGLLKPEQQEKFDALHEKMAAKRADHAEFEQWKAERDKTN
ncbi:Spy/CpxP family protein refolding chaperone [Stutzerimonas stutzeri]|uniref:Spy/CpxP family protein refolding chaperone n=1 Tax=Stutzerimonas stutzeri TaxID=316 RepID=UPI00210DF3E6|nr:Spy/CpxP family protein refolding chaperone [Stutzerimonas stutzeri]MCQ4321298.1 Spy/CpxP family protein refolding chaperone [Stutzerimonas stutzeri]